MSTVIQAASEIDLEDAAVAREEPETPPSELGACRPTGRPGPR